MDKTRKTLNTHNKNPSQMGKENKITQRKTHHNWEKKTKITK